MRTTKSNALLNPRDKTQSKRWLVLRTAILSALCLAQVCLDTTYVTAMDSGNIVDVYLYDNQDELAFQKRLEGLSHSAIAGVTQVVELDEAQRAKVELAAAGERHRFQQKVEAARHKTKGLSMQDQQEMQKAWQVVMPLREQLEKGLIADDSFFHKVVASVLTDEQTAKYEAYHQARDAAMYKAILRNTVAELERVLPLTQTQRDKLIAIVESRSFPKKVQIGALPNIGGILLARIPSDEIAELLDKQQAVVFHQFIAQYENQNAGVQWE